MDWDQYVRDDFLDGLDIQIENLEGNPLIDHQLGRLRDRETPPHEYEERTKTLASAMCYRV
ncbi:MAG: hypothetical protein SVU32_09320, partial [Candidatus Nanohaloarchaea archaeon]|nr:hypothetical protein [Candidatus Nanohaloarchaea archaeon]